MICILPKCVSSYSITLDMYPVSEVECAHLPCLSIFCRGFHFHWLDASYEDIATSFSGIICILPKYVPSYSIMLNMYPISEVEWAHLPCVRVFCRGHRPYWSKPIRLAWRQCPVMAVTANLSNPLELEQFFCTHFSYRWPHFEPFRILLVHWLFQCFKGVSWSRKLDPRFHRKSHVWASKWRNMFTIVELLLGAPP